MGVSKFEGREDSQSPLALTLDYAAMAAPTEEMSILVRGYRTFDSGYRLPEVWLIVKQNANGSTEVFEIDGNLTANDEPNDYFHRSSVGLIGSKLYVLRGQFRCRDSDLIFCLDTHNSAAGWRKCECRLPFPCPSPVIGVAGNFIYLFPQQFHHQISWGCLFDTTSETIHKIELPRPCFSCQVSSFLSLDPAFCAAFDLGSESRGVLLSKSDGGHAYLYNPDQNSWKICCDYKFLNPGSASLSQHAVLNGILYLSYLILNCDVPTVIISLYEILTGRLTGKFEVPMFKWPNPNESDTKPFLVAIADNKLCYLWHRNTVPYKHNKRILFIAKIQIFPESPGFADIVSEDAFVVNAQNLGNFIPFHYQNKVGEDSSYTGMQHFAGLDLIKAGKYAEIRDYNLSSLVEELRRPKATVEFCIKMRINGELKTNDGLTCLVEETRHLIMRVEFAVPKIFRGAELHGDKLSCLGLLAELETIIKFLM